jgi:predicted nuclease of predicted toxin-antitoxin system
MAGYLIDANLPRWFSLWSGREFVFVHELGPDWSDTQIWRYASAQTLTIVTKDADFSDRVLATDVGPNVIHFRIGNLTIRELHTFLAGTWGQVCRMSANFRLVQVYRDRIEGVG